MDRYAIFPPDSSRFHRSERPAPPAVLLRTHGTRTKLLAAALSACALALSPSALHAQLDDVQLVAPPQSALVYARDGTLIAELGPQARTVVSIRSLPAYVPAAFVAVEDRRF